MTKLFAAYGSLRPGAPGHASPRIGGLVHVGPCTIPGRLFVAYGYPALKRASAAVASDLFAVPALFDFAPLDAFEDYYPKHPDACWYVRRRVRLHEPRVWAWVYYYVHKFDRRSIVRSGDWLAFRNGESQGILARRGR